MNHQQFRQTVRADRLRYFYGDVFLVSELRNGGVRRRAVAAIVKAGGGGGGLSGHIVGGLDGGPVGEVFTKYPFLPG